MDVAAALEKDPFRPGRKLAPDPLQIFAAEREVAVSSQAVGKAVIGGPVAEEAAVGHLREINGQRPREEQQPHAGRRYGAQPALAAGGRGTDRHPLAVRKLRSAVSTPARRLA